MPSLRLKSFKFWTVSYKTDVDFMIIIYFI